MPLDGQDPYALLGVTPESSLEEVRERYRILVQIWHPDRHQSSPAKVREEVVQQMQRINAAYDFIKEARERQARERQARERQARERETPERETPERETPEREARDREARDREARERVARDAQQRRQRYRPPNQHSPVWDVHQEPSTIHAIAVALPSGAEGFTVRAYLDDQQTEAVFLDTQDGLLLFPSKPSMREYLANNEAHALVDIPGWESFEHLALTSPIEIPEDRRFDLDLMLHSLKFPPAQWIPSLFIGVRDLIREIADAFDLYGVLELLVRDSALDRLDDLLRSADRPVVGWSARRQLGALDARAAIAAWRKALREVEKIVCWPS